MDIYKYAAQNRLRFASCRGDLNVEQLFQLPLKDTSDGFDLNTVAKNVSKVLKVTDEESFVDEAKPTPLAKNFTVALEIVKDVIATKQAENQATLDRIERSKKRAKLLDAMAAKDESALAKASKAELQRQLDALDTE